VSIHICIGKNAWHISGTEPKKLVAQCRGRRGPESQQADEFGELFGLFTVSALFNIFSLFKGTCFPYMDMYF
jgi:hypothetical protein